MANTVTITYYGLKPGTTNEVLVQWTWEKSNTKEYQIHWWYRVSDDSPGVLGSDTTVSEGTTGTKQSTFSIPTNAVKVTCEIKPVAETHTVNDTEVEYWTADWCAQQYYYISNNPPETPDVPTVSIEKYTLTASLDNLDTDELHAIEIQFQVFQDDGKGAFATGLSVIRGQYASYSCTVAAGSRYKVRARSRRGSQYSDWSDYSSNVQTIPSAPTGFTACRAESETSVYLAWDAITNATSYELRYATERTYLENGSSAISTSSDITTTTYIQTGLDTGDEYFFQLRAKNDAGESGWSDISSVVIGETPSAPTTWSSTTTAVVGETVNLYWIHNSGDGSSETYARLELTIDGTTETHDIANTNAEDDEDTANAYSFDTSSYAEGVKILWRVQTAGITKTYGDWSVQRTVDIYAPPTLALSLEDSEGNSLERVTGFPFYISALAAPKTQAAIGYHLTIKANETYETLDGTGNTQIISSGDEVYAKYFDTTAALMVEFTPGNVDLANNISYTVVCIVSMNSGLTAESSVEFAVTWDDAGLTPDAEIGVDTDSYSAYIRPYCEDDDGNLIDGVTLSVYRREYDGSFTEIATGIDNAANTYITDPHPALDYARYRIIAVTEDTGAIGYYDVPGYPVKGMAIILQWDEAWTSFETSEENALQQPAWSGSILQLPGNVDVTSQNSPDVSLVEYIGRRDPVSYYGTQIGETATWKLEFPKTDRETLYQLRRLSAYMGDVYVREPYGSGYWAHVTVSFDLKHCGVTVPVTINVTRVEGGV